MTETERIRSPSDAIVQCAYHIHLIMRIWLSFSGVSRHFAKNIISVVRECTYHGRRLSFVSLHTIEQITYTMSVEIGIWRPADSHLTLGENALLYIVYVMHIWVPQIPATRWSCSLPQLIAMTADCSST